MSTPPHGVIIDRYQVEGKLGAGSMGDVVKAVDVDLKRSVAIKVLSQKHRDNDELEARFIREGRAVAAISHANVVQVFTTGIYDGRPYIAMELLSGTDLGTFVGERGPMPSLPAARAILDAARGLEAAANAGLIHRDVKPSNLVLLDNGVVKVTDFGLAKPLDPSTEPALTAMGVVVGTPDYIAPEQARGEHITEGVDLYALGGTLYFLLTGKPPFRKGNPIDDKYLKVVARHLKDPAPNPMLIMPEVDGNLARLQIRLMSKKPSTRPSYAEVIEELSDITDRLGGRRSSSPMALAQNRAPSAPERPTPATPYMGGKRVLRLDTDDVKTMEHEAAVPPPELVAGNSHQAESSWQPEVKRSRALIILTLLSSLVFLVGLGLFLFGPMPAASSTPAVVVPDAAIVVIAPPPPDAAPPLKVPKGMFLVPAVDDGKPVFMAKDLVTHGDFAEIFPRQKKPPRNKKKAAQSVSGVSFAFAQAYARTKGGRLPTPKEMAVAVEIPVYVGDKELWEWLDDGSEGTQAPRPVGHPDGRAANRRPRGHRDVGFRLVVDSK